MASNPATGAAATAGPSSTTASTTMGVVKNVEGDVSIVRGGVTSTLKAGDSLMLGDQVVAGRNGRASIEFASPNSKTYTGTLSPGGSIEMQRVGTPNGGFKNQVYAHSGFDLVDAAQAEIDDLLIAGPRKGGLLNGLASSAGGGVLDAIGGIQGLLAGGAGVGAVAAMAGGGGSGSGGKGGDGGETSTGTTPAVATSTKTTDTTTKTISLPHGSNGIPRDTGPLGPGGLPIGTGTNDTDPEGTDTGGTGTGGTGTGGTGGGGTNTGGPNGSDGEPPPSSRGLLDANLGVVRVLPRETTTDRAPAVSASGLSASLAGESLFNVHALNALVLDTESTNELFADSFPLELHLADGDDSTLGIDLADMAGLDLSLLNERGLATGIDAINGTLNYMGMDSAAATLSPALVAIQQQLHDLTQVGSALIDDLASAVDATVEALSALPTNELAARLSDANHALATVLQDVPMAGTVAEDLTTVLDRTMVLVDEIQVALPSFIDDNDGFAMQLVDEVIASSSRTIEPVANDLATTIDTVAPGLGYIDEIGTQVSQTVAPVIDQVAMNVSDIVQPVLEPVMDTTDATIEAIEQTVNDTVDAIAPVVTPVVEAVVNTGATAVDAVGDGMVGDLDATVTPVIETIVETGAATVDVIEPIVGEVIDNTIDGLDTTVTPVIETIVETGAATVDAIEPSVDAVVDDTVDGLDTTVTPVIETIVETGATTVNAIEPTVDTIIGNTIDGLNATITPVVEPIVAPTLETVTDASLLNTLADMGTCSPDLLGTVVEPVVSPIAEVTTTITPTAETIVDTTTASVVEPVAQTLETAVSQSPTVIESTVESTVATSGNLLDALVQSGQSLTTQTVDAIVPATTTSVVEPISQIVVDASTPVVDSSVQIDSGLLQQLGTLSDLNPQTSPTTTDTTVTATSTTTTTTTTSPPIVHDDLLATSTPTPISS
ncbi:MAG TPA: hypothetical protein VFS42_02795, partial [Burkholderiaceae bacterium]|nr:hypothetical protein [Burkholderiaceae bacterium]